MLQDLIAASQTFDAKKFDFNAVVPSLHFSAAAHLQVPTLPEYDGRSLPSFIIPTELAHRQLFAKLGRTLFKQTHRPLPFDYLMAMEPDLRAVVLNRHCRDAKGKHWKMRGYETLLRAVVDSNFPGGADEEGDYEITQLLKTIESFLSDDPTKYPDLKTIRPDVTPDNLHLKLVWRDVKPLKGNGGTYGLGVYIKDDECGDGKGKVLPFVQRTSCSNSIIFNHADAFEWIHRGYGTQQSSRAALRVKIQIAIGEALTVSAKVLDRVIEAEAIHLDDFNKIMDGLALTHGWVEDVKTAVLVGTEGQRTVMGIVNGVTYAAHTALSKPSDQVDLEMLGGTLLFAEPTYFDRAAMLARQVDAGLVRAPSRQMLRLPAARTFEDVELVGQN